MAWGKHGLTRTVKIPLDRDNRLIQLCNETGKTPNFVINRAIEFAVNCPDFVGQIEGGNKRCG